VFSQYVHIELNLILSVVLFFISIRFILLGVGPCGKAPPGAPSVDLLVGQKRVLKFQVWFRSLLSSLQSHSFGFYLNLAFCSTCQKNYDMFYAVNPGIHELNFVPGDGSQPINLWLSWDSDTTWTFVYEADFVVPNRKCVDCFFVFHLVCFCKSTSQAMHLVSFSQ
jgi:hypothetical protein